MGIDEQDSIGTRDVGKKDLEAAEATEVVGVEAGTELDSKELVSFTLDIDGEMFEVEMPEQEEYTVFDVLSWHVEKQGIELVTKKYNFGIFIQGIGEKIGDMNSFWLYYVNDRMANVSADNMVVKEGDVIKFEFSSNSPF